MTPNRIGIVSFFASLLVSVGGYAADCLNCKDGLVGSGPIKAVCPWCKGELSDPQVGFQDRASVGAVSAQAASTPTAINRKLSVVRVTVPEAPGGKYTKGGSGSGVVIGHEGKVVVLTCHHVIRERTGPPTVLFQDGTKSIGRVVKEDRTFDLAAIECDRYGAEPLPLAPEPTPKERLVLAGYGSLPYTYREVEGKIVDRWRPAAGLPLDQFEMTGGARDGDSGGPILNESNEVAGILFGSRDGRTWASHSGRVAKFLRGESLTAPASAGVACPTGKCQKK
jgi:S1-C subfamily serine protease